MLFLRFNIVVISSFLFINSTFFAMEVDPLVAAIDAGDLKQAQRLVRRGIDTNVMPGRHPSYMHYVLSKFIYNSLFPAPIAISLLDLLKQHNILASQHSGDFFWRRDLVQYLHDSIVSGVDESVLEWIIDSSGVDINASCSSRGVTPLMRAMNENRMHFAKLLAGKGARVNQKDSSGRTALHRLFSQSKFSGSQAIQEQVKTLMDVHADPTAQSQDGTTCFQAMENRFEKDEQKKRAGKQKEALFATQKAVIREMNRPFYSFLGATWGQRAEQVNDNLWSGIDHNLKKEIYSQWRNNRSYDPGKQGIKRKRDN